VPVIIQDFGLKPNTYYEVEINNILSLEEPTLAGKLK